MKSETSLTESDLFAQGEIRKITDLTGIDEMKIYVARAWGGSEILIPAYNCQLKCYNLLTLSVSEPSKHGADFFNHFSESDIKGLLKIMIDQNLDVYEIPDLQSVGLLPRRE